MDYDEAIEWLYGTQLFGIKLGLEGVWKLFDELNLFKALENRNVFHVAGTNGKGSTCAMIDSICRASDKRSGIFTSPHLICFRERIRVDGSMIPERDVAEILTQIRDMVSHWDTHPTFFELAAALAVKYFCQQEVEVLVIETGMGGRLDATNVMPTSVSVITSIDMDHQKWLGDDIETIAEEKAGIIKPGVPAIISSSQNENVLRVFDQTASALKAPLHKISACESLDQPDKRLKGPHQRLNAALAIAAIRTLWPNMSRTIINRGLREVTWPGRFDIKPGNIVIDGAHNPAAAAALVSTWKEEFESDIRATIVFGAADSKDIPAMLTELTAIAQQFVFVKLNAKRGVSVSELKVALTESQARNIPFSEANNLNDALKLAQSTGLPILVTGSLFLAGETLALIDEMSPCFESSEQ